jgi:hypothetical protein
LLPLVYDELRHFRLQEARGRTAPDQAKHMGESGLGTTGLRARGSSRCASMIGALRRPAINSDQKCPR